MLKPLLGRLHRGTGSLFINAGRRSFIMLSFSKHFVVIWHDDLTYFLTLYFGFIRGNGRVWRFLLLFSDGCDKHQSFLDFLAFPLHHLLKLLHFFFKILSLRLESEDLLVVQFIPRHYFVIEPPSLLFWMSKNHIFIQLLLRNLHRAVQGRNHLGNQLRLLFFGFLSFLGLFFNFLQFLFVLLFLQWFFGFTLFREGRPFHFELGLRGLIDSL